MKNHNSTTTDTVIVGSGIVGMACALALAKQGRACQLIDHGTPQIVPDDRRAYALGQYTVDFLDQLGIWSSLKANAVPVEAIEIFDRLATPIHFSKILTRQQPLNHIVRVDQLHEALFTAVRNHSAIELLYPKRVTAVSAETQQVTLQLADGMTLNTALLVIADGRNSQLRQMLGFDYCQYAYGDVGLVATYQCEHNHYNRFSQWFINDEVLAWLPIAPHKISIVWSQPKHKSVTRLALSASDRALLLAELGQHRLGAMRETSPAVAFDLSCAYARNTTKGRAVLIGDAAHSVHPLSGHGVNLGLADVAALSQAIGSERRLSGHYLWLRAYEQSRWPQVYAVLLATNALRTIHRSQWPLVHDLSRLATTLLNRSNTLKKYLVHLGQLPNIP